MIKRKSSSRLFAKISDSYQYLQTAAMFQFSRARDKRKGRVKR